MINVGRYVLIISVIGTFQSLWHASVKSSQNVNFTLHAMNIAVLRHDSLKD